MTGDQMKDYVTEALRYWEPRRIIFNGLLAAVTLFYFWRGYPVSWHTLRFDTALLLFVLAVGANIVYCAAYVPDIFAQASAFREVWEKNRWILFVIGVALAAVFTRWFAMGLFSVIAS